MAARRRSGPLPAPAQAVAGNSVQRAPHRRHHRILAALGCAALAAAGCGVDRSAAHAAPREAAAGAEPGDVSSGASAAAARDDAAGRGAPSDAAAPIEVATFNLQWLGSRRRPEVDALRTREEVEAIVALVVDELGLELLCLQEVNTVRNRERDGRPLHSTTPYGWLRAAFARRGFACLEGASGGAQALVIAYDTARLTLLEGPLELSARDAFELDADCRSAGLRRPLAARFAAGTFDFWLVGPAPQGRRRGGLRRSHSGAAVRRSGARGGGPDPGVERARRARRW